MLTDGLEWCGLLWCVYQTLILTAPIHCRASIAETLMQRHISTNLMKKQTHPDLRWPVDEHILIFIELFLQFVKNHKLLWVTELLFCNNPKHQNSGEKRSEAASSLLLYILTLCRPMMLLCRMGTLWLAVSLRRLQRSWETDIRGSVVRLHGHHPLQLCVSHGYGRWRHGDRRFRWCSGRRDVLERLKNQRKVFGGHGGFSADVLRRGQDAHFLWRRKYNIKALIYKKYTV